MSTRHRSRSAVALAAHAEWPHAAAVVLLSAIAVPLISLPVVVRTPLVLPSMSVIALASAAIIALAAWCVSSDRRSVGISLWDVSGAYAFLGFAAGMLSDPQAVLEFWSVPAEVRESVR